MRCLWSMRSLSEGGAGWTNDVVVTLTSLVRRGCYSHVVAPALRVTSLALWCGFSSTRGPAVTYASRDQVFRLAPGAVSGSWRGLRRRRRPLVAAGAGSPSPAGPAVPLAGAAESAAGPEPAGTASLAVACAPSVWLAPPAGLSPPAASAPPVWLSPPAGLAPPAASAPPA